MERVRTAWCITGAGYFLEESLGLLARCGDVTLFCSRAGEEVLGMYRFMEILRETGIPVVTDRGASSPSCGGMALGRYDRLVIAPATANTVAKCALGIADTLPTNLFAQAGKAGVPSVLLPTDSDVVTTSKDPSGRSFEVRLREVDMENLKKLACFPGVDVARSIERLAQWLHISF
ncbi:MAG: flavoprotein [Thermovirgaceae bacterium]